MAAWRTLCLSTLTLYSLTLFIAAFPSDFTPKPMQNIRHEIRSFLHKVGIVPGIEVFGGTGTGRKYIANSCLLVTGLRNNAQVSVYATDSDCVAPDLRIIESNFRKLMILRHESVNKVKLAKLFCFSSHFGNARLKQVHLSFSKRWRHYDDPKAFTNKVEWKLSYSCLHQKQMDPSSLQLRFSKKGKVTHLLQISDAPIV